MSKNLSDNDIIPKIPENCSLTKDFATCQVQIEFRSKSIPDEFLRELDDAWGQTLSRESVICLADNARRIFDQISSSSKWSGKIKFARISILPKRYRAPT